MPIIHSDQIGVHSSLSTPQNETMKSMHLSGRLWLLVLVCVWAGAGCDSPPAADQPPSANAEAPAAAGTAEQPAEEASGTATASGVSAALPGNSAPASQASNAKPPVKPAIKPTPEQIAKWTPPDYQPLRLLSCADGFGDVAVLNMALSADGKQFALGGAKLTLWNTKDSKPTAELLAQYKSDEVERPLRGVAISADGKLLAAGDQKGRVRVWNLSDQSEAAAFQAHDGHCRDLCISPNSQLLATTNYSGEVFLFQLPAGTKLKSLKVAQQELSRLEFVSDTLLVATGGETSLWDIETGDKESTLTTAHVIGPALGLSHDRRLVAFNDNDEDVQFWDVSASKPTGLPLRGAGAHLIEFSSDGKWIATAARDAIRIWHAATGTLMQAIDADGDRTSSLAWLLTAFIH